ncbi:MAG: 30S ribosomal protein S15 [Candidatus Portnoybacteria bacterium RBG_13_40_8]|uniref:Small ribosomal subunit protein uS15 n=1 Tax=Candidatus Portnoybacteria bacterium RBG_13_40_8 TaxID=1801990 RepID=A0A1G2F4T3_9BACT|nr:MAG: 30S ribosomal protein S15 [Candidatus Portnoybacteria bacterium RBG_13_40_8]OGZ34852.1 MAG: 30S ribosomal protein S15 [Candidatus Portnoybacteria bacterium RIFCSPHIGHO2_01_FULL_39_19]
MLTKHKKAKIIEKHRVHKTDTGSAEVQIAILTEEIQKLTSHLKKHSKDNHSRRGLLGMVSKRKRLLGWLEAENETRYKKLTKELESKK